MITTMILTRTMMRTMTAVVNHHVVALVALPVALVPLPVVDLDPVPVEEVLVETRDVAMTEAAAHALAGSRPAAAKKAILPVRVTRMR